MPEELQNCHFLHKKCQLAFYITQNYLCFSQVFLSAETYVRTTLKACDQVVHPLLYEPINVRQMVLDWSTIAQLLLKTEVSKSGYN